MKPSFIQIVLVVISNLKSLSRAEDFIAKYDSDNSIHFEEDRVTCTFELSRDPDDIKFLLSNLDTSEELQFNQTKMKSSSCFDPKRETLLLIHGFWSNSSSMMPTVIRKAILESQTRVNLIVVDWGKLSTPLPSREIYSPIAYPIVVRRNIPLVSQRVAQFVQSLVEEKLISFERLHIIGHSLGAHVAGGVGRVIAQDRKNNGSKIARITGLDPAGPLFQGIRVQKRISKDCANFVDIYHTAAGTLGTLLYDEGHANFFPNGGHHQPGCTDSEIPFLEAEGGSCSHSFVSIFFAASFHKSFEACRCDPKFYDYFVRTSCPGNCTVSALAGYACPSTARGQFYFETGQDPFSDAN